MANQARSLQTCKNNKIKILVYVGNHPPPNPEGYRLLPWTRYVTALPRLLENVHAGIKVGPIPDPVLR